MKRKKHEIILSPKLVALQAEVERLRVEMSMLLLEKDELQLVECKNIEMLYMLALGDLEYKAYEMYCAVLRCKRKTELIQAKKNRQERILLSEIEKTLDCEFAAYRAQLDEKLDAMKEALERSRAEFQTAEEAQEIKKLYREIVKALHPDLHPDITDAQLALFHKAVSAYTCGDLDAIRVIHVMVADPPKVDENDFSALEREKERLLELIQMLRHKIAEVRNDYPYLWKPIVQSEQKTAEKRAELEQTIAELKEALAYYQARLEEALR